MSGFSADWLALREPHDMRARNEKLVAAVAALLKPLPTVRIVDLACGTGSTLRALRRHLPTRQNWRLVDNDLGLLARAKSMTLAPDITTIVTPLDLNRDLEAALDGAVDLVVTSALLDLVSEAWLERLAVEIAARAIPLYAALSYDGRVAIEPHDPKDSIIVDAINRHQTTDKGFGASLGPAAAPTAAARFAQIGYTVTQGQSDWVIGPEHRDMQEAILAGWARAAGEIGLSGSETAAWLTRRREFIEAGVSSLRVGHVDLLAVPMAVR